MKNIAVKLWLGITVLIVIMLLLVWLFQIVFLENYYQQARENEILKKVVLVSEDTSKSDLTKLQEKLEKISIDYNAMIDVFDSQGNVNSIGGLVAMPMFRNIAANMFSDILKGDIKTERATHQRFNSEYTILGVPIKVDNNVLGGIIIYLPIMPIEDTSALLKRQLVYISIIVLLTSVVISYFLSRMFVKPILKINDAAESMASGDLEVNLDVHSSDEIGRLASTMNCLAIELKKVDQLRKDLIANISHELRTPLSIIKGYAETIRDVTGNSKEKRQKQLDIIVDESERLGKIVDDVLNLSQMQSGHFSLIIQSFSIDRTLEGVMNRYEILAEKLKLKINFENPGPLKVYGDESRIEQVFYNLMNNALNHTPEDGLITVRIVDKEAVVLIEISDTGSGISKEDLKYIWERYYKAEKLGLKRHIGTGLGLAIVKNILEAHKSKFGVFSTEGKGTTFWFELPKIN